MCIRDRSTPGYSGSPRVGPAPPWNWPWTRSWTWPPDSTKEGRSEALSWPYCTGPALCRPGAVHRVWLHHHPRRLRHAHAAEVRWTLRTNDVVSVKQIMKNLSPAQQRILDAAKAGRTRPYAGRAKPAIDRLVALELVTADYATKTRTREVTVPRGRSP